MNFLKTKWKKWKTIACEIPRRKNFFLFCQDCLSLNRRTIMKFDIENEWIDDKDDCKMSCFWVKRILMMLDDASRQISWCNDLADSVNILSRWSAISIAASCPCLRRLPVLLHLCLHQNAVLTTAGSHKSMSSM